MGDEQQRRLVAALREALVVKGRHDGLAGAGSGDDQVAMPVVHAALDIEPFEHLGLMRKRAHREPGHHRERSAADARTAGVAQGIVEAVDVPVRVVRLERAVGPVALEAGPELADDRGRVHSRDANIPLQAVEQRGPGQVRAADVGRVEAGLAREQPRLGVQPGAARLVIDLDLRAVLTDQPVERDALGCADVGGGQDP